MTPQQKADVALTVWQIQRIAKIPVEDRRIPDPDSYEKDLAILRQLMERA